MRLAAGLMAGAALLATGGAALAQAPPHKPTPLEAKAAEGMTLVLRDACGEATGALKLVYDDPGFTQLDSHLRAAVLEGADLCEARLNHSQAAFDLSRRAIQEPDASSLAWSLHIERWSLGKLPIAIPLPFGAVLLAPFLGCFLGKSGTAADNNIRLSSFTAARPVGAQPRSPQRPGLQEGGHARHHLLVVHAQRAAP